MWRNTALKPKIFFMDANALFPMAIWAFHMRVWTLCIAAAGVVTFIILGRWNLTPLSCMRIIRCRLIGPYRPVEDRLIFRQRTRW